MADINARTRLLVGTTANWAASDLVLGDGEVVLERAGTAIKMKAGNGSSKYSALPFLTMTPTIPPEYLTDSEADLVYVKLSSLTTAGGAPNANLVPKLGASGLLAVSMIPALSYIPTTDKATAGGPANANKVPVLDGAGLLAVSMIPALSYVKTSDTSTAGGLPGANKVPVMDASGLLPASMVPLPPAISTSTGTVDADKLVKTAATGKIDPSLVQVTTGGYKGTTDATLAVPAQSYLAGDYWINSGTGTAHASWGLPGGTVVSPAQQLIYNGLGWDLIGTSSATIIKLADGTFAAPSLAFVNDPDTGLYSGGANVLGLAAGGALQASIDASGLLLAPLKTLRGAGSVSGTWSIAPNTLAQLSIAAATAAASTIDINPTPADGTSTAIVRLFRTTNTAGQRSFQILRGDNTGTADHTLFSGTAGVVAKIGTNGGRVLFGTLADDGVSDFQTTGLARINGAAYGQLGVRVGVSGAAAPASTWGALVLESNADTGLCILTPNTNTIRIGFGDPQSPAAGQIAYLHSSDQLTFSAAGAVRLTLDANGATPSGQVLATTATAAAPSYAFANDTTSGMFKVASFSRVGWATAGVEKMRLLENADATLLVGATTATAAATGRGLIEVNGSTAAGIGFDVAGAAKASILATSTALSLSANAGSALVLVANGTESARLQATSQGELSVNTTSSGGWSIANRGLVNIDGSAGSVLGLSYATTRVGFIGAQQNTGINELQIGTSGALAIALRINGVQYAALDGTGTLVYTPGASNAADPAEVGFRQIPFVSTGGAAYTMQLKDRGKCIVQTANANVITAAIFKQGDVVTVANRATAAIGLVPTGVTCYWFNGSTTVTGGTRTLAINGMATYYFTADNVAILTGAGIS